MDLFSCWRQPCTVPVFVDIVALGPIKSVAKSISQDILFHIILSLRVKDKRSRRESIRCIARASIKVPQSPDERAASAILPPHIPRCCGRPDQTPTANGWEACHRYLVPPTPTERLSPGGNLPRQGSLHGLHSGEWTYSANRLFVSPNNRTEARE